MSVITSAMPDTISQDTAADEPARPTFDATLAQCRPELLRYLRSRVQNEEDAADIAQDAFTRLLQYRDDPQVEDLRLMLFRIANNLLTDFYRRNQRHHADAHVALDDAGPLTAGDRPQLERVADEQALQRLKHAITRLPPKCRVVFILSRFHGLTHGQIARKLGISVKMVEKHITRALTSCQSAVGDRRA